MFLPRAFRVALQFLTVIPFPPAAAPDQTTVGRSALYYPLVGLVIGAVLAGLLLVLDAASAALAAALLLTVWVWLTGALHLDGLADSADAWVGGLGDRDKTLAIMKDPYCGPAAAVALVLVLLLKFVALAHVIEGGAWSAVVLAPVLGRVKLVLLFLSTPYVREKGLGNPLSKHLPRRMSIAVIVLTYAVALLVTGIPGIWLITISLMVFVVLRRAMVRRIGGMTGDTAGALVELSEAAVLTAMALLI
jgi:adenosylcobinamide-GDP ribazoletransferase